MDQPAPEAPEDAQPSPDALDRRRHERRYCGANRFVSFVTRPGFPNARALVNDISTAGIGLVYSRRLEVGSSLFIQLGAPPEAAGLRMARVVHATRREDGTWVVGCQFVNRLSPGELRLVVPEADDGPETAQADGG